MFERVISYDELIVLALFNKFQEVEGRKRFQKLFYLLKKKYNQNIPFSYFNYQFGPYCPKLQNALDTLVIKNLIEEIEPNYRNPNYRYKINLTGNILYNMLKEKLDERLLEKIGCLYNSYREVSTKNIIDEVYEIAGISR